MHCMYIPVNLAQFRHTKQAEIRDDDFAVLQKDVFRFQVLVDYAPGVQISHSL